MTKECTRSNSSDENNSSPPNQRDDQALLATATTTATAKSATVLPPTLPQIIWPTSPNTGFLFNESFLNGNNSPTSPGVYYSTITSNTSTSKRYKFEFFYDKKVWNRGEEGDITQFDRNFAKKILPKFFCFPFFNVRKIDYTR